LQVYNARVSTYQNSTILREINMHVQVVGFEEEEDKEEEEKQLINSQTR